MGSSKKAVNELLDATDSENAGINATDLLRDMSTDLASISMQTPDHLADRISAIAFTLNYVADALDHEFRLASQRGRNMLDGLPQSSEHD